MKFRLFIHLCKKDFIFMRSRFLILSTALTTLATAIIGYIWITPLFVVNPIVVVFLSAAAGLIISTIFSLTFHYCYQRPRINHHRPATPPLLTAKQLNILQKRNWLLRAIRNSGIELERRNSLINRLQDDYRESHFQDLDMLDNWVQQHLSVNDPEILSIKNDWNSRNDIDRILLFRRHLERQNQPASCFKLKQGDFKNMINYIDDFLKPKITKEMFDREMALQDFNYSPYSFEQFVLQLAREGKTSLVKFALNQLADERGIQGITRLAVVAAANNNHLHTVKELIAILENDLPIAKVIFTIAIRKNYQNMFQWLLTRYSDEELQSNELPLSIENQIQFQSVSLHFFSATKNHNLLVQLYRNIRNKNMQLASQSDIRLDLS